MAAHLTENMELTSFFKLPSSQLIGSLGSVAPIVLMILLLLLCFPFKKKKHRLSIRTRKKDLNMSELIDLTKLEDGLSPERESLSDQRLHKGNTLPSRQAQEQSNGFSSELQQGNADSPKHTQVVNSRHQTMEKLNINQQRNLSPQAPGSNVSSPSSLQFRKLPVTPKEACRSRMLPLTQNLDNLVYESIGIKEQELYSQEGLEGRTGCQMAANDNSITATTHGSGAGPVALGGKDSEAAGSNNVHVPLCPAQPCQESCGQLQEMAPEQEAPQAQLESDSRRLSAMYARVCKRTKASQPMQPENRDEPKEQEEEEEPPPIPEKCFEHIYESLKVYDKLHDGGL
ncbi:PREDICTED: uncharacterized protein LOC106550492 [Thamnophis sirtalis]|uniref:Uncharacterized protein LOC106550492 n=1 Tax=Thamnophis sirtalis TaxID=35019 RepID=A0A6I9YI63_9SAUR|nr:PREDICTED: uncharacterized protein LOC106550492 [Thamnophis sirtalis]